MKRARILPPRKPRGESAKTTIANQDNQIRMLIDRIEQLTDELGREQRLGMAGNAIFEKTSQDLNDKVLAYTRLLGWQDCAREMLQPKG